LRSSVKLGSIFGVPIGLNFSWFLTFGFVILILAVRVYPDIFPDSGAWLYWPMAVVSGVLFFASILTHEMAHSLIARAYGIPVKGITLFIFGGVSQITKEATRPLAEFIMAFAGPATSVLLAGMFGLLWWLTGAGEGEPLAVVLEWLWLMNLFLGAFNLAPGFPMDGGRILRSALWGLTGNYRQSTRWASRIGQLMAYTLMAIGFAGIVRLVPWMDPVGGLWLIVLGMFLEGAARQSWRQVRTLEFLKTFRARDVMTTDFPTIEASAPIAEVLAASPVARRAGCVFVVEDQRVVGLIQADALRNLSRARWQTTPASELMTPTAQVRVVGPDEDAASILQTMEAEDLSGLPVVEDGRLLGLVSRETVARLLVGHRELTG
jgi:Zn-dependent protease/predicted transcriptional regulator